MSYIHLPTKRYPVTELDIRAECPRTSFATPFFAPDGYEWVFPSPMPAYDALTQVLREVAPVKAGNKYEQRWEVLELPASVIEQNRQRERAARVARIKAIRDDKMHNGGYPVGQLWFHSDLTSRTQQLGLLQLGANIPAGLRWKTMDGTFVVMTQSLIQQVLAAAAAQDNAIFAHAERLIADETLDASAGWPATYGGR